MHDGGVRIAEARNAYICGGMMRSIFVDVSEFCVFNVVGSDEREDVKGSSAGREGHNEVHAGNTRNRRSVSD
jgi:hypothetical protein